MEVYKRRVRLVSSVTSFAAAIGGGLAVPAAAQADEIPAEGVKVIESFVMADTISRSIMPNGVEADQFVLEQAEAGRSVDLSSLNTAEVAGVTLVWESGSQIDWLRVATGVAADNPEDVAQGLEIVSSEVGDADEADPDILTGVGLQAIGIAGATRKAGGCTTADGSRGKLTYCRTKYKIHESNSSSNFYFYDRWGTARGTVAGNRTFP